MASIREQYSSYLLTGLFVLAMITFAVQFQIENGLSQDSSILSNEIINRTFNDLDGNLSNQRDITQTQREAFEEEIPERGFGTLLIFSIVGVVQTFSSGIIGVYNILIVLPSSILGIPKSVTSIISSILIVTLTILAFRTYRAGE